MQNFYTKEKQDDDDLRMLFTRYSLTVINYAFYSEDKSCIFRLTSSYHRLI